MRVLGCTGGIGSGKSYVSAIFEKMGIPVYDSDSRAKALYDTDEQLREEMVALLGDEIIVDGFIQRPVIAAKIFGNAELLQEVEKLVHPAVMRDFKRWLREIEESVKKNETVAMVEREKIDEIDSELVKCGDNIPPFVILESAILLEKPIVLEQVDKSLVVTAPLELRIERVIQRDNTSRERVLDRLGAQWSDERRIALADFIIFADGKQALLPQIEDVYKAMCAL